MVTVSGICTIAVEIAVHEEEMEQMVKDVETAEIIVASASMDSKLDLLLLD